MPLACPFPRRLIRNHRCWQEKSYRPCITMLSCSRRVMGPDLCTAVLCFPTYRRRVSDVACSGAAASGACGGCWVWDCGPGGPTLNSLVRTGRVEHGPSTFDCFRVCSTPAHLPVAARARTGQGPGTCPRQGVKLRRVTAVVTATSSTALHSNANRRTPHAHVAPTCLQRLVGRILVGSGDGRARTS